MNLVGPFHPVIHERAADAGWPATGSVAELVDDLAALACSLPDCVGLAAPQVGIGIRVAVVLSEGEAGTPRQTLALIDPVILKRKGRVLSSEGCMTYPTIYGDVPRSERVQVSTINLKGERVEFWAEGFTARIVQHEIDHLDGVTIMERFTPIFRHVAKARLKAVVKESRGIKHKRLERSKP